LFLPVRPVTPRRGGCFPDGGGGGGSSWTPVQGTGISITAPTTSSYMFSVIDYISKTEVIDVSATLGALITSETNSRISSDNYLQSQLVSISGNYTPITLTQSISGNLQTQITNEVNLRNIQVISLSANYTPITLLQSVSGNLQNQINNLPVANIFRTEVMNVSGFLQSEIVSISANYTHYSLTRSISGNLQSQIDAISGSLLNDYIENDKTYENNNLLVLRPNGTGGVVWGSTPVFDHNNLTNIQGGTTGQYYHLTLSQFNDYIGKTEVTGISSTLNTLLSTETIFRINADSFLQNQINNISGSYASYSLVKSISGNLQSQLVSISANYVPITLLQTVSGDLQNQINLEIVNRIIGDSFLQSQINNISGNYASYSLVQNISGNLQSQINNITGSYTLLSTTRTLTGNLQSQITAISADYTPISLTQNVSGNLVSLIESSSTRNSQTISQSGHGFIPGDCLRYTGSIWAKANAGVISTSEAIGIVESVTTNSFINSYSTLSSGIIITKL
jgi:hypothetical protein